MSSDPAMQQPSERRREERVSVGHRRLQLDPCDGRRPVDCLIWDMSLSGARLTLAQNIPLPPEVAVVIGNVTHRARVVWRKDPQIGIEFLQDPEPA
jgi:hypothetical protein